MSDINNQQLFDYPIIYDLDMAGGIDKQGNIKELWNIDALTNSIKMWMSSYRGDFIRRPMRSGYITPLLMKRMNQVDVDEFEQIIRDGFNEDFRPVLRILNLEVVPNYERRYWEIQMEVYSPDLKIQASVSERIKAKTG